MALIDPRSLVRSATEPALSLSKGGPIPIGPPGRGFRTPRFPPALTGFLVAIVLLLPNAVLAQSADDALATEMRRIAGQLQCPVCEGTTVADSHAAIAADMRNIVTEKLKAGQSEAQILQYFVDRYGVAVLREPPAKGIYAAVWWVPVAALVLGLGAVYAIARSRHPKDALEQPVESLSTEDIEKYRRRLRDMEQGRS